MSDVLSFIDKAQELLDMEKAQELEAKLRQQEFDLNDYSDQIKQIQNMGDMGGLLEMLTGSSNVKNFDTKAAEKQAKRQIAIISSMTEEERLKPSILNASRKRRIANGSGVQVNEVNKLLKGYDQTKKLIKQLSGSQTKKGRGKRRRFRLPFGL